jgi:hypothetical protein
MVLKPRIFQLKPAFFISSNLSAVRAAALLAVHNPWLRRYNARAAFMTKYLI